MRNDRVKGNLDALLLAVLQARAAHGYEVIAELKRRSDGEFDLPEGTVYPSLHKLERQGLISSEWEVVGGRRRRIYRLTAQGRTALDREHAQWVRFSHGMNAVLADR